eukprot:5023087-Amphidinium_carterae.1
MGRHHALRDMWCKLARAGGWHAVAEQRVLLDATGPVPIYKAADATLLALDAKSYALDVRCVLPGPAQRSHLAVLTAERDKLRQYMATMEQPYLPDGSRMVHDLHGHI